MVQNSLEKFTLKIEVEAAEIFTLEGRNIILVRLKDGMDIELKEAKEIIANVKALADPVKKCFGITKIGTGASVNHEAREYFANCHFTVNQTAAMATVFNDLASRLLYNFYIRMNKPKIKNKGFSNVQLAAEWLIKNGA